MSNLIKSAVESSIGSKPYSADAAGSWSAAILEKCVARLVALDKPFKVQVACVAIFLKYFFVVRHGVMVRSAI